MTFLTRNRLLERLGPLKADKRNILTPNSTSAELFSIQLKAAVASATGSNRAVFTSSEVV